MRRDGFICQWCGSRKSLVVHHHKRSFMDIVNLVRIRCDENDLENFVGITLCKNAMILFIKKVIMYT